MSTEYAKKLNLHFIGSAGGGAYGLLLYGPHFQKLNMVSKIEARDLILRINEDLLVILNNNKLLRRNMRVYPFTFRNSDAAVFFLRKNYLPVSTGEIEWVSIHGLNVTYGIQCRELTRLKTKKEPIQDSLSEADPTKKRFPFLWECVEREQTVGTID